MRKSYSMVRADCCCRRVSVNPCFPLAVDLQMKPYRTDEYVHKLFYETARFSAFNQQWVVKARINNSQRDPHQSNERAITYQLILKTKTSTPMSIHFFALKGPFSDMKVSTQIYKHEFTETVRRVIKYKSLIGN